MARADAVALVTAAYRYVLRREPDPEGLAGYVAAIEQGRSATWLLEELGASEEFRKAGDLHIKARLAQAGLTALSENALSRELERCEALPRERYDALWDEIFASGRQLVVGQEEYARTHRERFFELMNAVVVLTRGRKAPRVLELGPSEFSAMYARLLPDVELVIADRPVPPGYIGFTEAYCREVLGCAHFAYVDLASIADLDANLPALGAFDLIVMTEVLEHLPIHPVDVLSRLLARLARDGFLYLTTPNFLSGTHLDAIDRGENPCAVYPAGTANWDAHHHYREYEAVELARYVREARGRLEAFGFSDCWDPRGSPLPAHRQGNLVLVAIEACT
jgi:SAM-dependent methyltransferase